ncbi:hypothetical protein Bpfe_013511, partial [Biomphalaria pfeifferi]
KYPGIDQSWQVNLTGHVAGQEHLNTLNTFTIRIYIPELKLVDAGKYFCLLYLVKDNHYKRFGSKLIVE